MWVIHGAKAAGQGGGQGLRSHFHSTCEARGPHVGLRTLIKKGHILLIHMQGLEEPLMGGQTLACEGKNGDLAGDAQTLVI